MTTNINNITPADVAKKRLAEETFVINVIANWCSDCSEQQKHLASLHDAMKGRNIEIFQLVAQQEKLVFLDAEHAQLVEQLGGHGYPRTVLVKNGIVVSSENVEVISEMQLTALALKFNDFL